MIMIMEGILKRNITIYGKIIIFIIFISIKTVKFGVLDDIMASIVTMHIKRSIK